MMHTPGRSPASAANLTTTSSSSPTHVRPHPATPNSPCRQRITRKITWHLWLRGFSGTTDYNTFSDILTMDSIDSDNDNISKSNIMHESTIHHNLQHDSTTTSPSILAPSSPTILFSGRSSPSPEHKTRIPLPLFIPSRRSIDTDSTRSRVFAAAAEGEASESKLAGAFDRWLKKQTGMRFGMFGFGVRRNNVRLEITEVCSWITETSLNKDGSSGSHLAVLQTPNVGFALVNVSKTGCCRFMLKDGTTDPLTQKERVRVYEVQSRTELSMWYTHLHKAKSLSIQPKRWSSGNLWADQLDVKRDGVGHGHPYKDRSAASNGADDLQMISEHSESEKLASNHYQLHDSTLSFRTESLETLTSSISALSRSDSIEVVSNHDAPPFPPSDSVSDPSAPHGTPATPSERDESSHYNHSEILGGGGYSACEDFFLEAHRGELEVMSDITSRKREEECPPLFSENLSLSLPFEPTEDDVLSTVSEDNGVFLLDTTFVTSDAREFTVHTHSVTSKDALDTLENMLEKTERLRAVAVRSADEERRGMDSLGKLTIVADKLRRSLMELRQRVC
ncbi:hypothetical protein BC829DRAFT_393551 [Chytridium lagenaria]|nr:hypothetical protein BC829DRAFT_393551 [Chytridium lagenaria]